MNFHIHATIGLSLTLAAHPVSSPVRAQLIPDTSLGKDNLGVVSDQLTEGKSSELINRGKVQGATLFHSFKEFNVTQGQRVYFDAPEGITSILSRVTGMRPSNIFGTIGVLGKADLFLLNPNGIVSGPNSTLDWLCCNNWLRL